MIPVRKRTWGQYWCPRGCGKRVAFQPGFASQSPKHRFQCVVCGWGCPDRATALKAHRGELLEVNE